MKDYVPKTNREIHELALARLGGRLYTHDDAVKARVQVELVFMPLAFMKADDLEKFRADPPFIIYEVIGDPQVRTSLRYINGMPMFFSMKYLDKDDAMRVQAKIKELAPPPEEAP